MTMKKTIGTIAIFTILLVVLGTASVVFAHGNFPQNFNATPAPYGTDMMDSGYGMMGGDYGNMMSGSYGMMGIGEEGPMHQAMVDAIAEALGLPADEIEVRHDAGESMWDIAASQGLSEDQIHDLMLTTHNTALQNAVEQGLLTDAQAEWMDAHMESTWDGQGDHCSGGTGMNW